MVTEKHTIVAKKGDVKLEIIKEGFEKKEGDWTSVATRLLGKTCVRLLFCCSYASSQTLPPRRLKGSQGREQ